MTDPVSSFDLAVSAYRRQCDSKNLPFHQPLEQYSKPIHNVLYLRVSSIGYLARYDVQRQCMLMG